jgi:hypothetical protein
VSASDPIRSVGFDALIAPGGAAVLSLVAGYISGELSASSWLAVGLYVALYVVQQRAGVVRFTAEFGNEAAEVETAGERFLPYQGQAVRITSKQRDGLKTLAERYPAVKNLAYELWTPAAVCFSRPMFLELRQILQQLHMADEMHDGQLKVNGKGEEAFGRWRAGDVRDFDAPPPPNSTHG